MYSLNKTECTITSVSTNPENMGSGGETRTGMSIYFEYLSSNEALDMFDPKLRPALYESAAQGQQDDLTGFMPMPKFKLEKPLCWPYKGAGYSAEIHPDLDLGEALTIRDVQLDKFQFSIQDEGRVGFKARMYLHPATELIGPLCELAKHTVQLTLVPPAVQPSNAEPEEESPQGDLLDSANDCGEIDVLYPKAVAAVRATKNPDVNALQLELKTDFNHAATLLARMLDDGVIEVAATGGYVVVEEDAAA